jgi:hypothetical protein
VNAQKPSLSDPAAVDLLNRLEKLIGVADAAFRPSNPFVFPANLNRLPAIVEHLQEFIGRETGARVPFWNCVKALDERRKKLGLISTLEEMVDRATSMSPSPMVKLLQAKSKGKLSAQEEAALAELNTHLGSKSEALPENLRACRSLFARVPSPAYEKLLKGLPRAILGEQVESIMDYAAYLDFSHRNQLWNARYMAALEDLYGFLLQFDYDLFYTQLNRVLFGRTPTATEVTAGHARFKGKVRQQARRRAKPKGAIRP